NHRNIFVCARNANYSAVAVGEKPVGVGKYRTKAYSSGKWVNLSRDRFDHARMIIDLTIDELKLHGGKIGYLLGKVFAFRRLKEIKVVALIHREERIDLVNIGYRCKRRRVGGANQCTLTEVYGSD